MPVQYFNSSRTQLIERTDGIEIISRILIFNRNAFSGSNIGGHVKIVSQSILENTGSNLLKNMIKKNNFIEQILLVRYLISAYIQSYNKAKHEQ